MIKERIIQLIEKQGIAKEKFFAKIGVTSANFRGKAKESDIVSATIAKILSEIPNLNLVWLITGVGEMLTDNKENTNLVVNEQKQHYNDYRQKYYDLLEKYNACLEDKDKMRTGITHTPAVYTTPNNPKLKS